MIRRGLLLLLLLAACVEERAPGTPAEPRLVQRCLDGGSLIGRKDPWGEGLLDYTSAPLDRRALLVGSLPPEVNPNFGLQTRANQDGSLSLWLDPVLRGAYGCSHFLRIPGNPRLSPVGTPWADWATPAERQTRDRLARICAAGQEAPACSVAGPDVVSLTSGRILSYKIGGVDRPASEVQAQGYQATMGAVEIRTDTQAWRLSWIGASVTLTPLASASGP